jgi:hypothetical protein
MQTIRLYFKWIDKNGQMQERTYQVPGPKAVKQLVQTVQTEIEPTFGSDGTIEFEWSGDWRDPA